MFSGDKWAFSAPVNRRPAATAAPRSSGWPPLQPLQMVSRQKTLQLGGSRSTGGGRRCCQSGGMAPCIPPPGALNPLSGLRKVAESGGWAWSSCVGACITAMPQQPTLCPDSRTWEVSLPDSPVLQKQKGNECHLAKELSIPKSVLKEKKTCTYPTTQTQSPVRRPFEDSGKPDQKRTFAINFYIQKMY